jgi:hypothetical protein
MYRLYYYVFRMRRDRFMHLTSFGRRDESFLTGINNEARVRRSIKPVVLGKAKIMSFEDIEEARVKRTVKEVMKDKGKRGRKHKSAALEADESETELEPEPEEAHAAKEVIKGKGKYGWKRKSAAQEADESEPGVAQMIDASVPWRAAVARII